MMSTTRAGINMTRAKSRIEGMGVRSEVTMMRIVIATTIKLIAQSITVIATMTKMVAAT